MWRDLSVPLAAATICLLLSVSHAMAETKTIFAVTFDLCDPICEGFRNEIEASGFDAEIVWRDYELDKARLPGLVAEAREIGADLILTNGTTATLGIVGTLADDGNSAYIGDIPVVFTNVANPFSADIAKDFDSTGRANLAGTFNRPDESLNINVIKSYDSSFDTLGLLYNSNEANSAIKHAELLDLSKTMGFTLVAVEMSTDGARPDPADIPAALDHLRDQGVRWIYVGSSSFLQSHADAFTRGAGERGMAVVSPYEHLVRDSHALISVAANLEDVGRIAAQQALRILRDGETPGDLPIVRATEFAYVVNMDVARKLERIPPFAFLQIAETVPE
ncbi:ABC transporter substrate-binding protein [Ruegeria marina]|uniref:Putative ABC transport system substrate-binding protein n=1 Tax=Ruegeria marina TaxID=639004 RepID=A0A1G6VHN4_9RHOB|nr:ABC transporter substrate-binding protein [Ruegeria marina]SDD53011.1 putative ABC transport system substrate-binding protein [Ruegeria marina]